MNAQTRTEELRRPPSPPGTPVWERCADCGELVRTDVACPAELAHACVVADRLRLVPDGAG